MDTFLFACDLISLGPAICLDESVLNLGNVACGKTSTAVLHIKNDSDVPTTFQVGDLCLLRLIF